MTSYTSDQLAVSTQAPETVSGDAWVVVGTIGAGGRAKIDRSGVITPETEVWSLDWWVGAEDRWHSASRTALVRQSLTESTPVVLSAMRMPGGEIEQRAWTAVDGATGLPVLIVEFHNATPVPVALALAFSCADSEESAVIDFSHGLVTVAGVPVALFSREPSRYGIASESGSAEEVTVAGNAISVFPETGVRSVDGVATAAFVFPVPHTATVRMVLPLASENPQTTNDVATVARMDVGALPPSDRVVSGWKAQLARAPRFDLPERQIEEAIDGARSHLLMHVAGVEPLRWPRTTVNGLERSELTLALDEQGLFAEAQRLVVAAMELQNADGSFERSCVDVTASWIVSAGRHVALTGDLEFAEHSVEQVASAVHWLSKRQRGRRFRRTSGFFASGDASQPIAGDDRISYDARWTARAYRSAIALLDFAGQPDAALVVRLHLEALGEEMKLRGIDMSGPGDGALLSNAITRLRSDLLEGEPLWTWPTDLDAHDPARTAAFLRNVRSIVVDDDNGIVDLLPGFGEQWLGQPAAMLRVPTIAGSVSFALRWHGARPALLWEVESERSFTMTCTSIDSEWSTTESRGEALLAAPVFAHIHRHSGGLYEHEHEESAEPPSDGGGSFS
ncbi:MAG: hypothetical protein WEA11_07780 [Acidimicrobiales bacterium]